jgi:hypothetical protein
MRSVWNVINKNREEAIKFLETQDGERYTFVKYDKENDEWLDPHDNNEECYPDEVAPCVTFSDDNGYIKEYLVTAIWVEVEKDGSKRLAVNIMDVNDYDECYDYPVNWLYGASECYIYEKMMELRLVKREG